MIFCYNPPNKFVRIYVGEKMTTTNNALDHVWHSIKKTYYGISDNDAYWWETKEEEQADRDEWFAGWDDERCWDEPSSVLVDTHY